jgi:ribosomal protein L23
MGVNINRGNYAFLHGSIPYEELKNFEPKVKPIILFKQFKLRLDKDGNNLSQGIVFPLYVRTCNENSHGLPSGLKLGVWYKSGVGECWINVKNGRLYTKGKGYCTDGNKLEYLAYRPGWHLTNTPWSNQRGAVRVANGNKGTGSNFIYTRSSEVWGVVEACIDIDATEKAKSLSTSKKDQCLQSLGDSEFYIYKTNENATKEQIWYIVDKIRVVKILDDDSVDSINDSFYETLSKESGRCIESDPYHYSRMNSDGIPYWKMPRENGVRYTQQDLVRMGYCQM